MKNKEFYKDKIYEVACKHDIFAVNKKTGEVTKCENIKCHDCLFDFREFSICDACYKRAIEWLDQEHTEPVLDDVEKRYLEAVLMPFKNRVLYVVKFILNNSCEAYLEIRIKSIFGENSQESLLLPYFDYAKMYTGMEKNKNYTIEELGLFADEEEDDEE